MSEQWGQLRVSKRALGAVLTGSLAYAGAERWRDAAMLGLGFSAYRAAVGQGLSHLPLFLAMDLRMIAEHGTSFTFSEHTVSGVDAMLRARYENQILNRLLREHCVQQALELLSFFKVQPEGLTAEAADAQRAAFERRAERLTLLLLERLAPWWPEVYQVNAAHLRDLTLDPPSAEAVSEAIGATQALEGPPWSALVERFVDAATGVQGGVRAVLWSSIIGADDLFELEHLDVLDREYLRKQVRSLIQVRESLPMASPHDLPIREEVSEVETRFMDQSNYPTGGFSELTNRGSFENLVLSELIYMGEGVDLGAGPVGSELRAFGIDLFDVRFVEGELLFYSRDSGQLLRKRRTLRFAVDMRDPLNVKYPDHPYQLGIMVVGVVLALVRDLVLLFFNDALQFTIHLLYEAEADNSVPEAVSKLREVLAILLEGPIQHGILQVLAEEVDGEVELVKMASWDRKTYFIGFTSKVEEAESWGEGLRGLRRASPPLFGAVVDLTTSDAVEEVEEHGPLIHLDLNTSTLSALKHTILARITTQ